MEIERFRPLAAIGLRVALVLVALLCVVSLNRSAWNALFETRIRP
jgi:hypothetical protein